MDVCLLCLYIALSCIGRDLCDGLITRPEESYCVSNCVSLRNLNREEEKAPVWAVVPQGKRKCRVCMPFRPVSPLLCNSPKDKASSQMMMMAVFARPVVDLNLSGKQMAYQRSTEMKVSVSTDTATDTVCRTDNSSNISASQ
jgi:hypothetical protein